MGDININFNEKLEAKDMNKYLGFDVLEHDRMVEIVDTILEIHFPEYRKV